MKPHDVALITLEFDESMICILMNHYRINKIHVMDLEEKKHGAVSYTSS